MYGQFHSEMRAEEYSQLDESVKQEMPIEVYLSLSSELRSTFIGDCPENQIVSAKLFTFVHTYPTTDEQYAQLCNSAKAEVTKETFSALELHTRYAVVHSEDNVTQTQYAKNLSAFHDDPIENAWKKTFLQS